MDGLSARCAAIDVPKRTAVVSIGWVDEHGQRQRQTRTCSTMTADLERLGGWLAEQHVTHVAMESTGGFWNPLVTLVEERHVTVVLANAAHGTALPGRTTDVRASEWLLELMQHGLIQGSFIPPAPIRDRREVTRYRPRLIEERTRAVNRVQQVLEDANITVAAVASTTVGASGRAMLAAISAGEDDPQVLADVATAKRRHTRAELVQALSGRVKAHHRLLLREVLNHIDYVDGTIARLSQAIAERTRPVAAAVERLCSLAGVKQRAAEIILAEIGADMRRFPRARPRCSWAASCPGTHERAGKPRAGRTRPGHRWVRSVLVQAAWAAIRTKGSSVGAQVRRIAKRRGEQRAVVAVAPSLLTVIYHVLKNGVVYEELGAAYFDRREPEQRASYHLRRLAELGYEVNLEPRPAA
jgi:transposase